MTFLSLAESLSVTTSIGERVCEKTLLDFSQFKCGNLGKCGIVHAPDVAHAEVIMRNLLIDI